MDSAKHIQLELTPRAAKALSGLSEPLQVQLELLFSCLVRKRIHFSPRERGDAFSLQCGNDKVAVEFRPIMTKACTISGDDAPDYVDFPIQRAEAFIPKWLKLDFKNQQWAGEFGWV